MRTRAVGVALALLVILSFGWETSADIYIWTDEQGIVHMTDQWDNVPAPMRSRVTVRERTLRSDPAPSPPTLPQAPPAEPLTLRPQPLQMAPDLPENPSVAAVPPSSPDYRVLIPHHRPFIYRPKRPEPPFPYNVRLDPVDPNFVWVGPNRVPRDTFAYPRIPLEKQAQFRERIRQLEQRRSGPGKAGQPQSLHR
jgi:hypothetical protein